MNELPIQNSGGLGPEGLDTEPFGVDKAIPWVTYMVIAICGVIFALGLDKEFSFYIRLSRTLVPRGTAIWSGAYWGLLTSAFVHGAFWHILFNMWWLKDFGALLEPTMGRIKYLLFILAAAIISSGAELAFNNDTGIGFSGVVYAMFGYALAARHVIPLYQQLVNKQTIVWLLGWLVLCIILTVTGVWNVANGSHIAGFLFGYCIGNAFTARAYIMLSRLGLMLLILLTILSAMYMPWSEAWKQRDGIAWKEKGISLSKTGKHADAIEALTKAIELSHKDVVLYFERGFSYGELGNHALEIRDLDKCIELSPKYVAAYVNRGFSFSKLGNYQEALKNYDRAIELDPKLTAAYINRGICHWDLGSQEKAISDFNKVIELNPKHESAYFNRGLFYFKLKNYQQTIKDLDKVVELNPEKPDAYRLHAAASEHLGNYQQAIKDYDKAIELNPNDESAYFGRGISYYKLKSFQQAIKDFGKTIELNPKYVVAYNQLAWVLSTCPQKECRDGVKAITYAQRACELTEWREPIYIDTLAAAHAENENFQEAVRWQSKALGIKDLAAKNGAEYRERLQLYRERKPYREK